MSTIRPRPTAAAAASVLTRICTGRNSTSHTPSERLEARLRTGRGGGLLRALPKQDDHMRLVSAGCLLALSISGAVAADQVIPAERQAVIEGQTSWVKA